MTLISNAVLPSFIFKCICILRKKTAINIFCESQELLKKCKYFGDLDMKQLMEPFTN